MLCKAPLDVEKITARRGQKISNTERRSKFSNGTVMCIVAKNNSPIWLAFDQESVIASVERPFSSSSSRTHRVNSLTRVNIKIFAHNVGRQATVNGQNANPVTNLDTFQLLKARRVNDAMFLRQFRYPGIFPYAAAVIVIPCTSDWIQRNDKSPTRYYVIVVVAAGSLFSSV